METEILAQDVCMDTQTTFFTNGNIRTYPCPYEADKGPVAWDQSTSYPARITVLEDGCTLVKPYKVGSQGPRHEVLFETDHCSVLMSQSGSITERWKFNKRLTMSAIWKIRRVENAKIQAFYQSLK